MAEQTEAERVAFEKALLQRVGILENQIHQLRDVVFPEGFNETPDAWAKRLQQIESRAHEELGEVLQKRQNAETQLQQHDENIKKTLEGWETTVRDFIAHSDARATWNTESKTYAASANTLGWITIGAFAAFIAGFGYAALSRLDLILAAVGSDTASAIAKSAAIGVLIVAAAAIPIWGLRILLRLFLNERRLRERAQERAAMTSTLVGLGVETKMADEHRNIILQAIYGDRAAGIVDDAIPFQIDLKARGVGKK